MPDEVRDRARALISGLGRSQREIAAALGIDESKLTKTLSGVRKFTITELAALAELGGTTTDWLIAGRAPRAVSFAFRAAESAAEAEATERLSDEVETIAVRRAALIEDGLASAPRDLPHPTPTDFDIGWANAAAALAADELGVPLRGASNDDLFALVERVFDVDIIVRALPEECDGASYEDDGARIIVLAQGAPSGRQRFTLGHELGHLFNNDSRGRLLGESMVTTAPTSSRERRANSFAGALLMPETEVRGWLADRDPILAFDDLVCSFGVSPQAASNRLKNLVLISETDRLRLGGRTSRHCATSVGKMSDLLAADAAALRPRRPLRLVATAVQAYRSGHISTGPIAALLDLSRDEVRMLLARGDSDADGAA